MNTTRENYSIVLIYTNCEEGDIDLEDGDGNGEDSMDLLPLRLVGAGSDYGIDFLSAAAVEKMDLPSLEEEEGFSLY
jgi:hypothetical protein